MREYLMQNAQLAQYHFLQREEYDLVTLAKRFKTAHVQTTQEADHFYHDAMSALYQEMLDLGIDPELMDILFVKERILRESKSLNLTTDKRILKHYRVSETDCDAKREYAYLNLDFYRLMKYFRINELETEIPEGLLKVEDFKRYSDIRKLIRNSPYYKELAFLSAENLDELMDQVLIQRLRKYLYSMAGESSVFAHIALRIYELQNIRMVLKAQLSGLDISDELRDLYA